VGTGIQTSERVSLTVCIVGVRGEKKRISERTGCLMLRGAVAAKFNGVRTSERSRALLLR